MFHRSFAAAVGLMLLQVAPEAFAASGNHVVASYGNVSVPFTHSVGDTFVGSQAAGFTTQDGSPATLTTLGGKNYFYDDFIFQLPTAPQATFNAAAVTLDLGSFLALGNFSARLYKLDSGTASLTTGLPSSGTPIQAWTSTSLLAGGLTGTVVLFEDVSLQAGANYALEFRGTIDGASGGSYGGTLNIMPVPEADGLALAAAGFGAIVTVSRRRRARR